MRRTSRSPAPSDGGPTNGFARTAWRRLNEASENAIRALGTFFSENALLLVLTVAAGVFVYGYTLTHLTFSIDEEVVWQSPDSRRIWLEQRRWGMYLIHTFLLPLAIYPFTSAALAIALLSLAAVLVVHQDEAPRSAKAVFCLLFIGFPTFAHIQSFDYMGAFVACAVLLVVIAERSLDCVYRGRRAFLAGALVALTVAIAAHQSLVFVFLTLILFSLTRAALDDDVTFGRMSRRLGLSGAVVVCATGAFYGVAHLFGLRSNGYVESYFRWGTETPSKILSALYDSARPFLMGTPMTYAVVPTALVPLVAIPVLVLRRAKPVLAALLAVAFGLSSLTVHLVFGTWMSSRSMMAVPFAFAGLWYFFYRLAAPAFRLGILVFTGYVLVVDSSLLSRVSLSQELTYKADTLVGSRILDRIYDVHPEVADGRTPVAFVGRLSPPRSLAFVVDEEFGGSFWSWDGGNPYRMYLFLQSLGLPITVQIAPPNEWPRARSLSRDMPAWPDPRSVELRDGLVIVKLSD